MKVYYLKSVLFCFVFLCVTIGCKKNTITEVNNISKNSENVLRELSDPKISSTLKKLVYSYPGHLDSADENHLYWKDGTVMIYDDGIKNKSHDEKLDNPDIEDMLVQNYVKGDQWEIPPPENFEPGRIRYEPFFLKMYGNNSAEVRNKLVNVKWTDGSSVKFSNVNGASDSLEKVIEELKQLPSEFDKYLVNPGGTFVWRNIAETARLSNHSFGTAIDINTKYTDYWQWSKNLKYANRIPMEIVNIFEKHGFIWGGKWYHYDTMHFEYRPELL